MSDDDPNSIRRTVVKGAAIGLFAPGVSVAAAEQGGIDHLADPVAEYPHPPFPKQQQPWPGLCSKMTPVPDHGETSYQGSGRLAGRKALVTGWRFRNRPSRCNCVRA